MPHQRRRHLESLLKKTMLFSPITGVFGHRQVGKTTLVQSLASCYQSLDLAENLAVSESDPMRFLMQNQGYPFGIDECQHSPSLFPAMKEWVRTHRKPGQLLLSGSVRFTSRKSIRESLTGRIIAWDLLPMDLSEIYHAPLPNRVHLFLSSKSLDFPLKPASYATSEALHRYGMSGGMPGIIFLRDPALREQKFETQLNTILERDLKLLLQTTLNYRSLKLLLSRLAYRIGLPLEFTALSRETRISVPTIKKLIDAMESMYLIRVLPTEGSRQKSVVFFEDAGEARYVAESFHSPFVPLLNLLFSNLHPQFRYRPELGIRPYQYRTRGGATVPLCFRKGDQNLGVIPLLEDTPGKTEISSAQSFVKTMSKAKVLLVHSSKRDFLVDKNIRALGISQLL